MTVPGSIDALLLGGQGGYQIERSLRFNSADSAYLVNSSTRTVAVGAYTFSFWIKRCALSSPQRIWSSQDASSASNKWSTVLLGADDKLYFYHYSAADIDAAQSNGVLRDPSAWYHIVFSKPASAVGTLYINGVAQTKQTSYTTDADAFANAKYIGRNYDGTGYSNCYLTEFYGIDGQALTPSSFGETNPATGVWQPKKYTGTYGTNGFYLKFADNSGTTSTTLGKDSSGNGNNWTPNNFSVTAGAGNDSLIDTPTPYADGGNGRGNYCTWNPLTYTGTISNGNLDLTTFVSYSATRLGTATFEMSTGSWYWEIEKTSGSATTLWVGIANNPMAIETSPVFVYGSGGTYYESGSTVATGKATYATNDIIGIAVNAATKTIQFYRNGTSQGSYTMSLAGPYFAVAFDGDSGANCTFSVNFGQRAFAYTPPSGFLALNTQNLPEPTIKKPNQYFDATLYTGNGTNITVTNSGGFTPDMVWHKGRSVAYSHSIVDAVRGNSNVLSTDTTGAESNPGAQLDITTGGFISTYRSANLANNQNSATYVGWQWKESATPGFDIVTYTGDGTTSANRLIDHSLGVRPDFVITKKRSGGTDYGWSCWHKDLGGNYGIWINLTSARNANMWAGYSNFSTTKFTPPDLSYGNETSQTYVNYLWSGVAGFSKFGSYTGNGSSDGPFVYCGFKPRWLMIKRSDSVESWLMFDTARESYNPTDDALWANLSNVESANYTPQDFLSNGFKIRTTSTSTNASGGTYIFAAFAETPFKSSLAR